MTTSRATAPASLLVAVMVLSGCGGDTVAADDTPAVADSASTAVEPTGTARPSEGVDAASSSATSTSSASPGSPATTAPAPADDATPPADAPQALLDLLDEGYGLSDDWVVETIVADLDSATGGLAIAPDGTMYQADFGYPGHPGDTLYRISPDGQEVETLVTDDAFAALTMTTFGPDGTLYQSAYGSDSVFTVDPASGAVTLVTDEIPGATGIVANDDGSLFVQGYDTNRIYEVSPDGEVDEWASDIGFSGPNGLVAGPDGTLYSVNHRNGRLFAVSPEAEVTELVDFPHATSHVAWLDDALYVTSREGYVVYRHDLGTGATTIIAGNGEAGTADGRGAAASFGRPNAITVGPDGALWTNNGGDGTNNPVSILRITHQPEQ